MSEPIKGLNNPLYLQEIDGKYRIVWNWLPGIYSLVPIEYDEDGFIEGWYWLEPKVVSTLQIEAYAPSIQAIESPTNTGYVTDVIRINDIDVEITFTNLVNANDIANAINAQLSQQLGSDYGNVASVVTFSGNDYLKLTLPDSKNAGIVIYEGSVFANALGFTPGEYYGDLPLKYRPYVEERTYGLFRWLDENILVPVANKNRLLDAVSSFDKWAIERNIRLKLLVDGFAYAISLLDQEASKLIDQLDLEKVPDELLEYLAYQFNLDINLLARRNNTVEAREILRSIMNIIHIKGTDESFKRIFRFLGLEARIKEFLPSATEEIEEPTLSDVQEFYERYLFKDSTYRNPVINYGTTVNNPSELPPEATVGSIIKSISDNTFYVKGEIDWEPLVSADRKYGSGNDPDPYFESMDWKLERADRPWEKIALHTYNNLKIISGFDVLPTSTTYGDGVVESAVPDPYRAWLRAAVPEPYDLSKGSLLQFIVDGDYFEFNFADYYGLFENFKFAKISEIKQLIETRTDKITVTQDGDFIVFKSRRIGHKSEIQAYAPNAAFGFTGSEHSYIGYKVTDLTITSGQANVEENPGAPYPQVTTSTQTLSLGSGVALDGTYEIYVDGAGTLYLKSDVNFPSSLYSGLWDAWVKPDMPAIVQKIATLSVQNGGIVKIEQERRQSDFRPTLDLTEEQLSAVRAYMRSFKTTANINSTAADGPYVPSYYRIGTDAPREDGIKNELVVNATPFTDVTIDAELGKLIRTFIELVRPVHVKIIDVLLQEKPKYTYYPIAADRPGSNTVIQSPYGFKGGDQSYYMPGYISYDQDVYKDRYDVYQGDGTTKIFYLNYSQNTFQEPTGLTVYIDGVATTSYTFDIANSYAGQQAYVLPPRLANSPQQLITIGSGDSRYIIEFNTAPAAGSVIELVYRSPLLKFDFELEVHDDITYARQMNSGWFDQYKHFNPEYVFWDGNLGSIIVANDIPSEGDYIAFEGATGPDLYRFTTSPSGPNDVQIVPGDLTATMQNLATAIGGYFDGVQTVYTTKRLLDATTYGQTQQWGGYSAYSTDTTNDWTYAWSPIDNYYSYPPDPRFRTFTMFDPWRVLVVVSGLNGGTLREGWGAIFSLDYIQEIGGRYSNRLLPYFAYSTNSTLGLPAHWHNTDIAAIGFNFDWSPTTTLGRPDVFYIATGQTITPINNLDFLLFIPGFLDGRWFVPEVYDGNTNLDLQARVVWYDQPNKFNQLSSAYYDAGIYRGRLVNDRVKIRAIGTNTITARYNGYLISSIGFYSDQGLPSWSDTEEIVIWVP